MEMEDRLWLLLGRVLSREATPAEELELQQLLQEHPEYQHLPEMLAGTHMHREFTFGRADREAITRSGLEQMKEKMQGQAEPPPAGRRPLFRYAVAAGLLLLLGSALFAWLFMKPLRAPGERPKTIATARGEKTALTLPDGTRVWLNAQSTLQYGEGFGISHRELSFTGEACFDAARNEQHPLLIHTSDMQVRVLGTTFNIKAYPGDGYTETTLLKGKIQVRLKDRPGDAITLQPEEKLVLRQPPAGQPISKQGAQPETAAARFQVVSIQRDSRDSTFGETAWITNKLVFRKARFEDIAKDMERWYNVRIVFRDEQLKQEIFSGTFDNERIRQALAALQLTTSFKYEIKGNEIYLYR